MQKLIGIFLALGLLVLVMSGCSAGETGNVGDSSAGLVAPTVEAPAGNNNNATTGESVVTGPAGGVTIFVIDQAASQARFELNEELRGQPKTVVGTTNQVVGEIAFDLSDLSTAQVGQIVISAGSFSTDSNLRNRAIRDRILQTGNFEMITFTPTAVNGLPAGAVVGDEINFTIDGDLAIRDITNPVTFAVTATVVSAGQISGTASTVINRADYNLNIPSVPNVANVEEEVELYLDFLASAS